MQLSMFYGARATKPTKIDSDQFWEDIKTGRWEKEITELRNLLRSKGKEAYNEKKKELSAITMSGLFLQRAANSMVRYSGLIQGDIDSVENPEMLRDELSLDPHVRASFLSPSGKGVKLAIRVPDDPEKHKESFFAAERYFLEKHGVTIDPSCKDINRICFTSFDPELKGNEDAIPIEVGENYPEIAPQAPQIQKYRYGTVRWDEVFQSQGMVIKEIGNTILVQCPWRDLHTTGKDGDRSTIIFTDGTKAFKCSHAHCESRGPKDLENYFTREVIARHADPYENNFAEPIGRPRKTKLEKKVERNIQPIAKEFLNPPGFVGDWAKFITDTAWFPQPELALGASLAFTATMLGRKIRDESDIRPNIYVAALGRTGIGKEHARKVIKLMFAQTGVKGFGAEKLSSRSAIERTISATPSALYMIDEFGHYISSIMNPNSNSHLRDVSSMFLELYGSSSSKFFGTDKANAKENPRFEIDQPSASIYGTSTKESFWGSLTSESVSSGTLNRFIIVEAPEERPPVNDKAGIIGSIPVALTTKVRAYYDMPIDPGAKGNITEFTIPRPLVITSSDAAKKIFRIFQKETLRLSDLGADTSAMWVRAAETAKKIALILAGSRFTDITADDANYGCELTNTLIKNACVSIRENLSDNEFERESKRVEAIIRNSGPKGITTKDLVQRTRFLKSRIHRKTLLDDLYESELVNRESRVIGVSSKPSIVWFCE